MKVRNAWRMCSTLRCFIVMCAMVRFAYGEAPIKIKSLETSQGKVNVLSVAVERTPFEGVAVYMIDVDDADKPDYLMLVHSTEREARLFMLGNSDLTMMNAALLHEHPVIREVAEVLLSGDVSLDASQATTKYRDRRRELPEHLRLKYLHEVVGPKGLEMNFMVWKPDKPDDSVLHHQHADTLAGRTLFLSLPDSGGFGMSWADQGPVGTFREMSLVTPNEYGEVKRRDGGWAVSAHGVAEVPWKTCLDAVLEINAMNSN